MNPLVLLLALRRLVPSAIPSLTLTPAGDKLSANLCEPKDPPTHRFYSYQFDDADLQLPAEELAETLAKMHAAQRARWVAQGTDEIEAPPPASPPAT